MNSHEENIMRASSLLYRLTELKDFSDYWQTNYTDQNNCEQNNYTKSYLLI